MICKEHRDIAILPFCVKLEGRRQCIEGRVSLVLLGGFSVLQGVFSWVAEWIWLCCKTELNPPNNTKETRHSIQ